MNQRTDPPVIMAPVIVMIYEDGNKEIASPDGQVRAAHPSLDRCWKLYEAKVREFHAKNALEEAKAEAKSGVQCADTITA